MNLIISAGRRGIKFVKEADIGGEGENITLVAKRKKNSRSVVIGESYFPIRSGHDGNGNEAIQSGMAKSLEKFTQVAFIETLID
jgi:hypothetical protein